MARTRGRLRGRVAEARRLAGLVTFILGGGGSGDEKRRWPRSAVREIQLDGVLSLICATFLALGVGLTLGTLGAGLFSLVGAALVAGANLTLDRAILSSDLSEAGRIRLHDGKEEL